MFSGVFFALAGVFGPIPGLTQDVAEPVPTLESAWVVGTEAGGERLVSGRRPAGAEQRLYTARFRYEGTRPAPRLRIVLEIPAGMQYIAGSALGPGAEVSYSVDGGQNFSAPGELALPTNPDDPESPRRPATAADYTHIRWELPGPHPPGLAGLVSYRASPVEGEAGNPPAPEAR